MTEQQIIEPEARLLVELGQERGLVYEDELAVSRSEIDLEADDMQALRDELAQLGVDIVDPPAPEERIEVVEVEIATTNSLDLFLRQAGRYPLLTKDEEVQLAKRDRGRRPDRQAPHDRVQPAPGGVDRQAVPRTGRALPRSDPGGRAGAEPRGREVRLAARPQVLDLRDLVDSPGGAALDRKQRPHHPPARPRVRPAARDRARARARSRRAWGASRPTRRSQRRPS